MQVTTPGYRKVRVGRRWLPWRPRKRDLDLSGLNVNDAFDDLAGIIFVVVLILVAIFAPFILAAAFLVFEFALVFALIPLAIAWRVVLRRPWTVQVTEGRELIGAEKVRGWRASGERIREIAAAYERGDDPFPVVAAPEVS